MYVLSAFSPVSLGVWGALLQNETNIYEPDMFCWLKKEIVKKYVNN